MERIDSRTWSARRSSFSWLPAGRFRIWYSAGVETLHDNVIAATDAIRRRGAIRPRVAVVLGSGLGGLSDAVEDAVRIPPGAIPHYPRSTVLGHAGELVFGRLSGVPVMVLAGRTHLYEGFAPAATGFATRVARALGSDTLIVTNAAGGLNPALRPGDLVLITDHLSFPSLAGHSPLVGVPPTESAPRFVDLSGAYSTRLRQQALEVAAQAGIPLRQGVYIMVGGPNFETPAEVRFLRLIGGDLVGMSTVPEVIVARQVGLEVLGISVVSNLAAGLPGALLAHEDVLRVVAGTVESVITLIRGVLSRQTR